MKRFRCIFALAALCCLLSACGNAAPAADNGTVQETATAETAAPKQISRAEQILEGMTLEQRVWQMFFVAPEDIIDGIDTAVSAGEATKRALADCPVGGIIYFGKNIKTREQVTEMIANTQSFSDIPLFISVDEEGGRVARLGKAGLIDEQPAMGTVGAMGERGVEKAGEIGSYLGKELSALGFNMDFAPVADVITVENNDDIGDRSFGTDPEMVARMVSAEVKAMQEQNVCATLKHFPSNGSTSVNTHYASGVCTRTPEEMRRCEFIPFKAGIDAGADAVMVAHMAAVNVVGDDTPSTLSPIIIEEYLRGELGFGKVVISDALNMGAITSAYTPEDAAVMAVKAGVDLILMSPDVRSAQKAVLECVNSGEISEERVNESVLRILKLKDERGLLQ